MFAEKKTARASRSLCALRAHVCPPIINRCPLLAPPLFKSWCRHCLTVADPGRAPPKIRSTMCVFKIQFFIRMLKNKAQIALESIKTTPELPGPLSGPWTPAESEFGYALVMCMRAHNLLHPPPPPNENPGSASDLNTTLVGNHVDYCSVFKLVNLNPNIIYIKCNYENILY